MMSTVLQRKSEIKLIKLKGKLFFNLIIRINVNIESHKMKKHSI